MFKNLFGMEFHSKFIKEWWRNKKELLEVLLLLLFFMEKSDALNSKYFSKWIYSGEISSN